jgi:hypothetical protein
VNKKLKPPWLILWFMAECGNRAFAAARRVFVSAAIEVFGIIAAAQTKPPARASETKR